MPTARGRLIAPAAGLHVSRAADRRRSVRCKGTSRASTCESRRRSRGTLQKLAVQRGAQVASGAPLFALESDNEIAARRQAEQQLQAAEARLANLMTGKRAPEVEMVAEQLRQARAARELSAANLRRQEALFKSGFISKAALDDVRARNCSATMPRFRNCRRRSRRRSCRGVRTRSAPPKPMPPPRVRRWLKPTGACRAARGRGADGGARQRYLLRRRRLGSGRRCRREPAAPRPTSRSVSSSLKRSWDESSRGKPSISTATAAAPDERNGELHLRPRRIHAAGAVLERRIAPSSVYLVEAKPAADVAAKLNAGQPVDVVLSKSS